MSTYTHFVPGTGQVIGWLSSEDEITQDGYLLNESDTPADSRTQYVMDRVLLTYTEEEQALKDSLKQGWEWRMPDRTLVDVRTLVETKAAKNLEINKARMETNLTSFQFSGKRIACDALSRGDIDGVNGYVSLTGTFRPGWKGAWKAIDNSYVPIATVDDWKLFYAAMCDQGQINFDHAQALKAQLAAATENADVDLINW